MCLLFFKYLGNISQSSVNIGIQNVVIVEDVLFYLIKQVTRDEKYTCEHKSQEYN